MSDLETQSLHNAAATAMEDGQRIIRNLLLALARDAFRGEHDDILREAVSVRRRLQDGADEARKAAMAVFNARRREQRATGAESLREVG